MSLPPPPPLAVRVRTTVVVTKVVRIRKAIRDLRAAIAACDTAAGALFAGVYAHACDLVPVAAQMATEADRLRIQLDAAAARSRGSEASSPAASGYERIARQLDGLAEALESTRARVEHARSDTAEELEQAARAASAELDLLGAAAGDAHRISR